MIRDVVIFGCGGFGRETADVIDAINRTKSAWNLLGFVDERPSKENVARVESRASKIVEVADLPRATPLFFVVAIANSIVRARLAAYAESLGLIPGILVHPTAAIGANLVLGQGSIIGAHVCIGSDAKIGQHVHLDRSAQVGHDSEIGDFATVHPAAVISGACVVGRGAELGTNCTLLPRISIGANSTVGAAACVTRDVESGVTVYGVPAR